MWGLSSVGQRPNYQYETSAKNGDFSNIYSNEKMKIKMESWVVPLQEVTKTVDLMFYLKDASYKLGVLNV